MRIRYPEEVQPKIGSFLFLLTFSYCCVLLSLVLTRILFFFNNTIDRLGYIWEHKRRGGMSVVLFPLFRGLGRRAGGLEQLSKIHMYQNQSTLRHLLPPTVACFLFGSTKEEGADLPPDGISMPAKTGNVGIWGLFSSPKPSTIMS